MRSYYEQHEHPDPQFPFYFHLDTLHSAHVSVAHWHESIELLYLIEGKGTVFSNMIHYPVSAGDIAIINSNNLHDIYSDNIVGKYYCLIVDKTYCDGLDIAVDELQFQPVIYDDTANQWMDRIVEEMDNSREYYPQAVQSAVIGLLVHLCRHHLLSNTEMIKGQDEHKITMVKAGIGVIQQRYKQSLSVEQICESIGYSKYYFCRVFKEYTGKTVLDYINFLRCYNARTLITQRYIPISAKAPV